MRISIITINKNNSSGLAKTMKSVASQSCRDFEYIVVDGASTDGSVEVMLEWEKRIKSLGVPVKTKSEPDSGLYNAMNKGVLQATGEYLLMLNSGDYLVDSEVIAKIIPELDGTDIVQGNTIRTRDGKEYVYGGYRKSEIDFFDVYCGKFAHQAAFCKRALYEKYGIFDESYMMGGDTVFFLKTLGFSDTTFRYVDINVSFFDCNGISSLTSEKWKEQRKKEDIMYDNLVPPRILQLCKEYSTKSSLYDYLKNRKVLWYVTMFLVNISRKMEKWKRN